MSVITKVPETKLWDQICEEFESRAKVEDDQKLPLEIDYDAAKYTPVFFGPLHKRVLIDANEDEDFDPSISHPACVGYAFVDRPPEPPTPEPPAPPNKHECSPREYLECYIFPWLLPALEELLRHARFEKCFERKRTKFEAVDFLTEYLYKKNPQHQDREEISLADIPFVKEWWTTHPRPAPSKSLLWTEQEAVQILQNFWRGYKVREEEAVQELRQWQKECREESKDIHETVNRFWSDKIPSDNEAELEANKPGQPDQQQQQQQQQPQQSMPSADAQKDQTACVETPNSGITDDDCANLNLASLTF